MVGVLVNLQPGNSLNLLPQRVGKMIEQMLMELLQSSVTRRVGTKTTWAVTKTINRTEMSA